MLQKIYVMSDSNGLCKIGISKDPKNRLAMLQCGNTSKLSIVFTSELLSNACKIETMMHKRYKDKRVRGEWFCISDLDSLVEEISLLIKEKGKICETVNHSSFSEFKKWLLGDVSDEHDYKQMALAEKTENERIYSLIQHIKGHEVTGRTDYVDLIKSMPEEKQKACIELISSLINYGWGYEQIKSFVTENATKRIAS